MREKNRPRALQIINLVQGTSSVFLVVAGVFFGPIQKTVSKRRGDVDMDNHARLGSFRELSEAEAFSDKMKSILGFVQLQNKLVNVPVKVPDKVKNEN